MEAQGRSPDSEAGKYSKVVTDQHRARGSWEGGWAKTMQDPVESSCSEPWAANQGSLEGTVHFKGFSSYRTEDRLDGAMVEAESLVKSHRLPSSSQSPRGSPLRPLGGQKEPPKASRTLEGVSVPAPPLSISLNHFSLSLSFLTSKIEVITIPTWVL